MRYCDVAIPLGHTWSSPFAKWQGTLADLSTVDVATAVTARALADRRVDPAWFAGIVFGWTVPQPDIFYGAPTLAARLGATGISGPMVSQACATSVAALHAAAGAVAAGAGPQLVVTADRISNGRCSAGPRPAGRAARRSPRTGCSTASSGTRGRVRGCSTPPRRSPRRWAPPVRSSTI
ncbi:hypothetical protein PA7_11120 [Pseudonocardia asaccharolytica DSM 44247 = NBRC 16224]|uniref:Thiolase N-terminal domain-containing protein n=1 Tax=Pseudonocardia asaccharolytica DSM 44247 = NBRC 16224 TaxID=1123024 RepID=A0A511CXJ4_9PSEU|nr:hypothetical protein PA7_11120 [Pseudonocardia asaccharolytica DSM 44247 = NBRC 16224]